MDTYENREAVSEQRRLHPWSTSATDPTGTYHDFRAHPELIPVACEDFVPWGAFAAVGSFYDLLAWINGPESPFESNDCAFVGPEDNDGDGPRKRLRCTGRLGLLFRNIRINTDELAVTGLIGDIHERLRVLEPGFAWGAVGTTRLRVDFLTLPDGFAEGWQVLVSFWAWGDEEAEVFENLSRVIRALHEALESLGG